MANASSKKMGAGAQGKSSGTGAMTDLQEDLLGDSDVLDNREKAARGEGDMRGMDGKGNQTQQYQDHAANRRSGPDAGPGDKRPGDKAPGDKGRDG